MKNFKDTQTGILVIQNVLFYVLVMMINVTDLFIYHIKLLKGFKWQEGQGKGGGGCTKRHKEIKEF